MACVCLAGEGMCPRWSGYLYFQNSEWVILSILGKKLAKAIFMTSQWHILFNSIVFKWSNNLKSWNMTTKCKSASVYFFQQLLWKCNICAWKYTNKQAAQWVFTTWAPHCEQPDGEAGWNQHPGHPHPLPVTFLLASCSQSAAHCHPHSQHLRPAWTLVPWPQSARLPSSQMWQH